MKLTNEHKDLLKRLGLPEDFDSLTDEQWFAVNDTLSDEMQLHGINAAGDGLNDYGEMCVDIITSLPE